MQARDEKGPTDLLAADPHLKRLVSLLRQYDPERILLFGSRARGQADEFSDYDVAVVKRSDRPFLDRLQDMVPYLVQFDRPADILVYTPEEFERMGEYGLGWVIRQEGVLLYERSPDVPDSAQPRASRGDRLADTDE